MPEKLKSIHTHLRTVEVLFGFILFTWGAFSFVSWASAPESGSLVMALAGFGAGCLMFVDAHRALKKAALLDEGGQDPSGQNDA